jgi:catechol 2,3-dioxygenase-like lactoylglutathione lyase family enzyme
MRFRRVQLRALSRHLQRVTEFYVGRLGLEPAAGEDTGVTIGETQLVFRGGPDEPFYHFAFLVPGNRFGAALDWIREVAELLPDPESGEFVFDFDNWDARACYLHDPAGNIVELIAHRGVAESSAGDSFSAAELVGISELGLVGDRRELAAALGKLGLEQWAGDLDAEGRLAFVGEKARTVILSPPGRGWLPTGRPAEPHPTEVEVGTPIPGVARVGPNRIVGILQS